MSGYARRTVLGLGFALLLGAAGPSHAAPPQAVWKTSSAPLQVESKTLETFGAEGRIVFEGDVVARQGDLRLQADRLEVRLDKTSRAVRTVHADGNVRINKGEIVAAGGKATYDAESETAVLTGDPKVWRERDVVAGDRITLFLAEDRSVVEGARAVIYQPATEGGAASKPSPGGQGEGGKP